MKTSTDSIFVAHAVYRLYDAEGALLYIGHSKNVEWRIRMHLADLGPTSRVGGAEEIQRRYHHHTFEVFETRAESIAAERAAIRTEAPELNRQHNPTRWRFDGIAKRWVSAEGRAA